MSFTKNCRIGVVSWPVRSPTPRDSSCVYITIGEIFDKKISNNLGILSSLHKNLKYLYPFKIKRHDNHVKVHNEEDFKVFRKKYKITTTIKLHNINKLESEYNCDRLVFRTPSLYNISCMRPLFKYCVSKQVSNCIFHESSHTRIFIVLPYSDPILRGQILDECISKIKSFYPLFILVGDKYGKNKESTSTLMTRYLLSRGISIEYISKNLYDHYPDSIIEIFELIPFLIPMSAKIGDIMVACQSTEMVKIMSFIRDNQLNTLKNIQYLCE